MCWIWIYRKQYFIFCYYNSCQLAIKSNRCTFCTATIYIFPNRIIISRLSTLIKQTRINRYWISRQIPIIFYTIWRKQTITSWNNTIQLKWESYSLTNQKTTIKRSSIKSLKFFEIAIERIRKAEFPQSQFHDWGILKKDK